MIYFIMYEKLSQPFLESFNHFFTGKFDLKNYALTESYKIDQKISKIKKRCGTMSVIVWTQVL